MEITIVGKNNTFDLEIATKQAAGERKFYFGAGWDAAPGSPVDLDLVAVALTDGKLVNPEHLVYFGWKNNPTTNALGIFLSEDNQTGEGEGDDEDITIDTANVPASVDSIAVGIIAYAGADLHAVDNMHFRVCDGQEETSPQIADIAISQPIAGSNVLHGFMLKRTATGWILENVSETETGPMGGVAVKQFGNKYTT
jgi:stress response protein SCP2